MTFEQDNVHRRMGTTNAAVDTALVVNAMGRSLGQVRQELGSLRRALQASLQAQPSLAEPVTPGGPESPGPSSAPASRSLVASPGAVTSGAPASLLPLFAASMSGSQPTPSAISLSSPLCEFYMYMVNHGMPAGLSKQEKNKADHAFDWMRQMATTEEKDQLKREKGDRSPNLNPILKKSFSTHMHCLLSKGAKTHGCCCKQHPCVFAPLERRRNTLH